MFLTFAAYRNQALLFFFVFVMMAFGLFSYFSLPAREDPAILVREAVVATAYPGLDAEQIEQLLTKPLEEEILQVPEIEEITSISQDGLSIIKPVIYDRYTDLEGIWDQLEETVDNAAPLLPQGTLPSTVIDDFGDVAVITLAVHGTDFSMAEKFDYAQHIRDQLIGVDGTKKIDILGALQERVYVEFEDAVLSQAGLTPDLIAGALAQQNIIQPGGQLDTGDTGFILKPTGEFKNLGDIESAMVRSPLSGDLVRIGDIATVRFGVEDPPQSAAYYNGEEAIILAIAMHGQESVITYSERASAAIDEVRASLPVGLALDVVTYESDKVERAVYGVTLNMLQTLAIVLGVVILFLGVRSGLIVGAIIPSVILAVLAIMGFFTMPLERMSLATIIIALGLLVDNGIVVAEDFKKRMEEHGDRDRAMKETSSELAQPLFISSAITISVFLPLMIAQTESSEYTRSISLVVLIALSVSWVFAMTVTTTLCHRFIKVQPSDVQAKKTGPIKKIFNAIETGHMTVLKTFLRVRILYVALMIGFFALGGYLMSQVSQRFFPESDTPQVLVYVDLPAGVTSRTTDDRVQQILSLASDKEDYPEFEDMAGYVGFGGPRFVLSLAPVDPGPNVGFIVINAVDVASAEEAITRLRSDIRQQVPDVNARISRMFLGPQDTGIIQVQVKGPDADYIYDVARELEVMLSDFDGMIDIWSDWQNRVSRFDVVVDQQLAREANVTSADIATALGRYVSGQPISEFRDGDEVFPIMLRAVAEERNDLSRLDTIAVFPRGVGASVPLAQVAEIKWSTGFGIIEREDLTRTITVEGRNLLMTPEDLAPLILPKLEEINARLAPGHSVELDGILADSGETNAALAATLPMVFAIITLLLIAQFRGYRKPLVILLCLPFIVTPAAIGLLLLDAQFGFMVILGLYALAGIIINNSVVLMDRIELEMRDTSRTPMESVIAACQRRFTPILMTAITTIVGLLPLIIAKDVLFFGMSVAIAFGLGIGTFLITLGLVPVLFCLFHGITYKTTAANEPDELANLEGAPA